MPIARTARSTLVYAAFSILSIAVAASTPAPCAPAVLQGRLPGAARIGGGKAGVAIMLVETGDIVATLNGDDRFPMQSVYKLPIAMAALDLVDRGTLSLDQSVRVEKSDFVSPGQHSPIRDAHPEGATLSFRELLRFTVSESDGTTSDVVMRLTGGPSHVGEYLRGLGVDAIKVMNTEQEMGRDAAVQYRNWATPRGAVALLHALQTGRTLSDASRALLHELLTHGARGSNRIAGLLPKGTIVAHKPGSSGTDRSGLAAATNDIGLVTLPDGRHLAIAAFITDSKAGDANRDEAIARVAQTAWECFAPSNR